MSHTPGPWETIFDGALAAHKEHWRVISSTSGLTLAVMQFSKAIEANARLIAAAPALLEALEAIIEAVDDEWQRPPFSEPLLTDRDHALLNAALAAVAAARGGEAGDD